MNEYDPVEPQPLVGILTTDDPKRRFRGNRKNFIDIIRKGDEMGVSVYVITESELDLKQKTVLAHTYNRYAKKWEKQRIPIPGILYNRIPSREEELNPRVRKIIRECMKHPDIQLFNPSFFNKWKLLKWMKRSGKTRRYVPVTRKFSARTKLLPLFRKSSLWYLKPEQGKAGQGIMRVQRSRSAKLPYTLTSQDKMKSRAFRFKSLRGLRYKMLTLTENDSYIIQQGIQLVRYQGRPFDLRALVQKDGEGKWAVTGIGARVAGRDSITTHVPRGGSIEDPQKLLDSCFGSAVGGKLLDRAGKMCLRFAKQIERASGQTLGEMSLDLGIDQRRRIWFFEANAKPMKFDEPHIRQHSLEQMLQYCLYLAKNKNRRSHPDGRNRK